MDNQKGKNAALWFTTGGLILMALLIWFDPTVLSAAINGYAGDTPKPKSVIHVSHLTPTEVGITCANGADPAGVKTGDVLVISCGQ